MEDGRRAKQRESSQKGLSGERREPFLENGGGQAHLSVAIGSTWHLPIIVVITDTLAESVGICWGRSDGFSGWELWKSLQGANVFEKSSIRAAPRGAVSIPFHLLGNGLCITFCQSIFIGWQWLVPTEVPAEKTKVSEHFFPGRIQKL